MKNGFFNTPQTLTVQGFADLSWHCRCQLHILACLKLPDDANYRGKFDYLLKFQHFVQCGIEDLKI